MKILFLDQAFHPDVVASGQVLTDLAVSLAQAGHQVTVVTGANGYDDTGRRFPLREIWNGIEIRRVPAVRLGKGSRWRRVVDFGSFLTLCALRLATLRRHDVVVAMTSPPLISVLGALFASLRRGRLVVWVMDLNPDEAIAAGWLRSGSHTARLLQRLLDVSLRRAATVVVLDRFMRDRILARGIDPAKVTTIPPWSHDDVGRFDTEGRERFRSRHGLAGKFVVMYAGNHSPCHPLDTLLHAARELRTHEAVRFAFVGGGSEVEKVRRFAEAHRLPNIVQLPYQPLLDLAATLSAADLHAVALGDPFVGIVHPCKIYNILRVGGPVLYIGPPASHIADLAARLPAGFVTSCTHGDVAGVVAGILAARGDSRVNPSSGRRSEPVARQYSKALLLPQLVSVLAGGSTPLHPRSLTAAVSQPEHPCSPFCV